MPQYRIGIDFGTTNTRVAVGRQGELPPVALSIGTNGEPYMPSVVSFSRGHDGSTRIANVGERAKNALLKSDTIVLRSVKRCLSCHGDRCYLALPDGVKCETPGTLRIGETNHSVESIVRAVIREALERALRIDPQAFVTGGFSANLGGSVVFDLEARKLLCRVASTLQLPGVGVDNIIEEPVAVSRKYAGTGEVHTEKILVYDFGGGTFDAAIVDLALGRTPMATVLATGGAPQLGGDDIDAGIRDLFVHQACQHLNCSELELQSRLRGDPLQHHLFESLVEAMKLALSTSVVESIERTLPGFPGGSVTLRLSHDDLRSVLEDLGLLRKAKSCLESTYRVARLILGRQGAGSISGNLWDVMERADSPERWIPSTIERLPLGESRHFIDHVLLAGGVTRMREVRVSAEEIWGRDKILSENELDPITAAAIGAAYDKDYDSVCMAAPPCSVYLRWPGKEALLYQAFDAAFAFPIVFLGGNPFTPGRGHQVRLPSNLNSCSLVIKNSNDTVLVSHALPPIAPRRWVRLEIDPLAQLHLVDCESDKKFPLPDAPWQHALQRGIAEDLRQRLKRNNAPNIENWLGNDGNVG